MKKRSLKKARKKFLQNRPLTHREYVAVMKHKDLEVIFKMFVNDMSSAAKEVAKFMCGFIKTIESYSKMGSGEAGE